jgi:hypothetical protein
MPDLLLRRPVCAVGQPACTQVRRRIGLAASDRDFPALTGRSGMQRARRVRSRSTPATSAGLVLVTTAAPVQRADRNTALSRPPEPGRCRT